jgi:streptomycin 6-kinase
MDLKLPLDFQLTITSGFGDAGKAWLNALPDLISACERRWSFVAGPHFTELSYNYVAPAAFSDDQEFVLKLGVPRAELVTEAEALRKYNGQGSVRLLDAAPEEGILLLERLSPGSMLAELWPEQDEQATHIAAAIMRRLWRTVPADYVFVTVQDWFEGFGRLRQEFAGGSGPFPAKLVDTAEGLYAELQASMDTPVLLHGDLHHFNILAAEREPWLAIDPKGVVGEAAYDTGALLRNPVADIYNYPQVLARRIAILAEDLELDRQRITGWGVAQAVLSAWWSYEDHGCGWEPAFALAETLLIL